MVALDTNLLIYAHKEQAPFHAAAKSAIGALLSSGQRCCIPWPCVHEFLNVATNPRLYRPSSSAQQAFDFLQSLFDMPTVTLIGETGKHWDTLTGLITAGAVVGPQVHDARIAAICLQHGVTELWSVDRDFSRFPSLKVVNPLRPA